MTLITRRRQSRRRSAFTLLEVLVVVAIIVAMAGVASIYVFKYLDDSKKSAARASCHTLATAVETFITQNDGNPPENNNLQAVRPYIKETGGDPFIDPWRQPYNFALVDINGKPTVKVFTHVPGTGEEISNLTP
jgi:general secretion pathway protein G